MVTVLVILNVGRLLPQPLAWAQAGDSSDPVAQCKLADRCYAGDDLYHAELLYSKAAVQGLADAQFGLGRLLMVPVYHMQSGKVIARKPNFAGAAEWLLRAANQGHVVAQVYLGNFYRDGKGVKQDYVEAFKWYEIAVRSKNTDVKTGNKVRIKINKTANQSRAVRQQDPAGLKKFDKCRIVWPWKPECQPC